jgi:hypothetical protein
MKVKPLQPLTHGSILIVGAKASNFSDEIKNHPRVTVWDSQEQHWTDKNLPANTRAVFVTRFIGHAAFKNIIEEARKRQITIFNPEGTGIIVRQVKELLSLNKEETMTTINESMHTHPTTPKTEVKVNPKGQHGKLHALIPFINFNQSNTENADILMLKATELHITSTRDSLANFVGNQRKAKQFPSKSKVKSVSSNSNKSSVKSLDASIEIFDDIIKNLKDMRQFLIDTTRENGELRLETSHGRINSIDCIRSNHMGCVPSRG